MPEGHDHCGGGCEHDDSPELGIQYSLHQKIDVDRVQCLNELEEDSGKYVFKPWEDRLNNDKVVESDADEELLFNIPFTGSVKLKGIIVVGGDSDSHPSRMRLFSNQPGMTFDDVVRSPEQEFEMHQDGTGTLEYATKVAKFSSVSHLSIHFPSNFGSPSTKIIYIGLKGEFTPMRREKVVIATFEARANPADHKTSLTDTPSQQIT